MPAHQNFPPTHQSQKCPDKTIQQLPANDLVHHVTLKLVSAHLMKHSPSCTETCSLSKCDAQAGKQFCHLQIPFSLLSALPKEIPFPCHISFIYSSPILINPQIISYILSNLSNAQNLSLVPPVTTLIITDEHPLPLTEYDGHAEVKTVHACPVTKTRP
jgi:hypothetical protein